MNQNLLYTYIYRECNIMYILIITKSNELHVQGMRMSDENVETLHLTSLQRQHIGEYSCAATNQIGENHSSTLNLRVQCKCFLRSMAVIDTIFNTLCVYL